MACAFAAADNVRTLNTARTAARDVDAALKQVHGDQHFLAVRNKHVALRLLQLVDRSRFTTPEIRWSCSSAIRSRLATSFIHGCRRIRV